MKEVVSFISTIKRNRRECLGIPDNEKGGVSCVHGSGGGDGESAQRHDDADAPEKHGDGQVVRKDLPPRASQAIRAERVLTAEGRRHGRPSAESERVGPGARCR